MPGVDLPEKLETIGANAFNNCTSLKSIAIPDGVTSIGDYAFTGCPNLTTVKLPADAVYGTYDSSTYRNKDTFDFQYLTNITIPDTISISWPNYWDSSYNKRRSIFENCTTLTIANNSSGSSPSNLWYLAVCISCCEKLKSLTVEDGNPNVTAVNGVLYSKDKTRLIACAKYVTSVSIPKSVKSIGQSAFYGCTGLTKLTIPDSVTSVGQSAFSGCSGLTEITLPFSAAYDGTVFYDCNNVTNLTITKGKATDIGAFIVDNIRWFTLKTITVDSSNPYYTSDDNVLYNKDKTELLYCPQEKKSITIPDSVQSIGKNAFYYCQGLTKITIPGSVTTIGENAFSYCYGLTSIKLSEGIKSIGQNAFTGCNNVKKVFIPESVTSIGSRAFGYYSEWDSSKVSGFTISGYIGSAAEKYATDNSFAFVPETLAIANCTLTLSEYLYTYDGTYKRPEVTVTDGSRELIEDRDYTLEYTDNLNAGKAGVTVTGINTYAGTVSESFTISPRALNLSLRISGWTFGDEPNEPVLTGNAGLADVTFEYKPKTSGDSAYSTAVPTKAGTYTLRATVAALPNYKGGTVTADFIISLPTEAVITFDANGGFGTMEPRSVDPGSTYMLPECGFTAPSGKEFDQWSIGGSFYPAGSTVAVNGDMTVTALWKDDTRTYWNITIIANNGSGAEAGTRVNKGESYTLPGCGFSPPAGKGFYKWSIDGKLYSPGDSVAVNSDITVTAVWSDRIPGDANGDGNVNMQDYALLQRRLAGWNVTINEANSDLDGDGVVNMQDYALLQRKLAGWDI